MRFFKMQFFAILNNFGRFSSRYIFNTAVNSNGKIYVAKNFHPVPWRQSLNKNKKTGAPQRTPVSRSEPSGPYGFRNISFRFREYR